MTDSNFIIPTGARAIITVFDSQLLFQSVVQNDNYGSRKHENSFKFISIESLSEAVTQVPLDSGWIPPGVVRCGRSTVGSYAVMYRPPARYNVFVDQGTLETIDVYLPALVFIGLRSQYYLLAASGNQLDPHAPIFVPPVPNVNDIGAICFGRNPRPDATAATIGKAWETFWTAPFNDHHADGKSKRYPDDVCLMLREVAAAGTDYPVDDLTPLKGTIEAAINKAIFRKD